MYVIRKMHKNTNNINNNNNDKQNYSTVGRDAESTSVQHLSRIVCLFGMREDGRALAEKKKSCLSL